MRRKSEGCTMGSLCCFRPFRGRAKVSDSEKCPDEEEQSVDSEPYSPKNLDFLKIAESNSLAKVGGEQPPCPPSSRMQERGNDSDGTAHAAVDTLREDIQRVLGVPRDLHHVVDKSPLVESKCVSFMNHNNGGFVSPADSEKTYYSGLAVTPINDITPNRYSKSPIIGGPLHEPTPSFRWEHDSQEPYRMEKTVESWTTCSGPVQKTDSTSISHGHHKVYMNRQTGLGLKDDYETLGWYIHVGRTRQCILNHHQLRPIMDELGNWTMQVPGTFSLRYKHTSGMDVFLPWPDLRTASKQEIEKFVETVNKIERRTVFFYLFMEHPKSIVTPMTACLPPPSPNSVTKLCVRASVSK